MSLSERFSAENENLTSFVLDREEDFAALIAAMSAARGPRLVYLSQDRRRLILRETIGGPRARRR